MDAERTLFALLVILTAVLGLRAALHPSPPAARALALTQSLHHDFLELKKVASWAFSARDCGELQDALVRVHELAHAMEAKLDQLEAAMAALEFALWPMLVFRVEGADVVVHVAGVEAGGLAVGAGGPGLRWNPATWELKEIEVLAPGATLVCQDGCGPGELRFVVLSATAMRGPILRLKGQGQPALWVPPRESIQIVDAQNKPVNELVVVFW